MVKVSIVGSAGRRADIQRLNKTLYNHMIDKTKEVLTDVWKLQIEQVELVSGGAAWSDHVAVALYLSEEFHSLKLHFPAKWQNSHDDPQFHSTDQECSDYIKNPGGVANRYHKLFSSKIGENSLLQIQSAIDVGATFVEHKGFHKRNTAVAQSSYLLAFTWGEGNEPKKGGTYNTWVQCKGTRLHIPLSSLSSSGGQKVSPSTTGVPKAKSATKICMSPETKGVLCSYKRKRTKCTGTKSPPCKKMKMTMYDHVQNSALKSPAQQKETA